MCLKKLIDILAKKAPPPPVVPPIAEPRVYLKDFETFEELAAWFDLHDELRMEAPNLCDDYSRESRLIAEMDGYHLGCCLVHEGRCYSAVIFPDPNNPMQPDKTVFHIGNLAIVTLTQECYYVDLAFDKLIKLCNFVLGGKY